MLIPIAQLAEAARNGTLPPTEPSTRSWSSIIGIVTAIIGNVLISFALNTQRYAHVRLDKEYQRQRCSDTVENGQAKDGRDQSYGTLPSETSVDRSTPTVHADGRPILDDDDDGAEYEETLPLLAQDKEPGLEDSQLTLRSDDASSQEFKKKNYLRSPYWWIGMTLMVVGEAGNFLAYGFAPASIVSPLGVVALISNCLIAPIMLKERFRKRDLLGVVIAVTGAVIVVLSAEGSNPRLGPDRLWSLITHWEFETYLGITIVLIVGLTAASNTSWAEKTMMIDIGVVGLCGGYTALSTKGVASLLTNGLWHVITFPITYLMVLVLIVTAFMQIKYVNRALQRFDSTSVIPAQFVSFTIFVVLGSAVLYRDFESATGDHVVKFFAGVVLTFCGVWCITSGRGQDHEPAQELEADDEQGIDLVDEETADDETHEHSAPATPKAQYKGAPRTPQISRTAAERDSPASFATAQSNLNTPTPAQRLQQIQSNSEPLLPSELPGQLSTLSDEQQAAQRQQTSVPIPRRSRSHRTPQNTRPPETPGSASRPSLPSTLGTTPLHLTTPAHDGSASTGKSSRRSLVSGMLLFPGPIASPLSPGLSAVAANQRRRRESTHALHPQRRHSPATRASVPNAYFDPAAAAGSGGARPRNSSLGAGRSGGFSRRSTGASLVTDDGAESPGPSTPGSAR